MTRIARRLILSTLCLLAPLPLGAQQGEQRFTTRDAWIAGGFAVATVAMFPLDRHLAHAVRDSSLLTNRFLSRASSGVERIADPGAIVIGASMYAVGRVTRHAALADIGWHGTEAVILSGAATTLLKGLFGRERPYASSDTNPRHFQLGRGFSSNRYESFPSGHTTVAFAAASAVTSETRRWAPRSTWLVAPALYGGATLVGVSRMYHNAHWASDVVLGAAIGTFSGLKVVRYSHANPRNFIDRVMLPLSIAPSGAQAATLSYAVTF